MQKAIGVILLLLITGCAALQDNPIVPTNNSPETAAVVEPVVNTTNTTNTTIVEEVVVSPVNFNYIAYIIDTEKKGSSVLMVNNHSMLINSLGNADSIKTLKVLSNLGIIRLDYFVLTNELIENIVSAPSMLLRMKPSEFVHSGIPSNNIYYTQYMTIRPNATILPTDKIVLLGDSLVNFYVPYDDGLPLGNDTSFLVKSTYGDLSILFATDCGVDCETRLQGKIQPVDIVVSNGGCDSLNLGFLIQTSPELVILSGKDVCQETKDRVVNYGINTLTTLEKGNILIYTNGEGYEYITSK